MGFRLFQIYLKIGSVNAKSMSNVGDSSVAIFPSFPDPNMVIGFLEKSFPSRPPDHSPISNVPNVPFFYIKFKSDFDARSYCEKSRRISTPDGNPIIVSQASMSDGQAIWGIFNNLPWSSAPNPVVDLSELSKKGTNFQFNRKFALNFLLFLIATRAAQSGTQVTELNLDGNGISNTFAFSNLKTIFPNLTRLSLRGNPLKPEGLRYIQNKGYEVVFAGESQPSAAQPMSLQALNPPGQPTGIYLIDQNGSIEVAQIPGCPDMGCPVEQLSLDNFKPIQIDENKFPTNKFFISFFQTSWDSIDNIARFYDDAAQFSLIVEQTSQNPSLEKLKDFAHNIFDGDQRVALGVSNVIEVQKKIFGSGFWAHPMAMRCSRIGPNLYGCVFHGVYQTEEGMVLGFDRTFSVAQLREMAITNDNICIRTVK